MSIAITPPASSPSPAGRMTPADLQNLPNEKDFELVDGQLEERNMGFDSSRIGATLVILLGMYCRQMRLGPVIGADYGYQCFPDDLEKIRKPDVSFIRAERLVGVNMSAGYSRIAPDLAVEVISINDLFVDVSKKVQEYLAAGIPLVWVLDPESQQIYVHRSTGATILSVHDELSGEDVVPGFRCQVSELFAPPPGLV